MFLQPKKLTLGFVFLSTITACTNNKDSEFELFRSLNQTLSNQVEFVSIQNAYSYKEFEKKTKDPLTARKTEKWMSYLLSVQHLSKENAEYFRKVNGDLIIATNNIKDLGIYSFTEEQLHSAASKFVKPELVNEINKKFKNYRDSVFMFPIIENEYVLKDLNAIKKRDSILNIDQELDQTSLKSIPLIAFLVTLNQFEIAVRRTEHELVRYINIRTDHHDRGYEIPCGYIRSVFAILNSSVLKQGEIIEATAGVGAMSILANPEFTINNRPIKVNASGVAVYRLKTDKLGKHSITLHVKFMLPDSTVEVVRRRLEYEVVGDSTLKN